MAKVEDSSITIVCRVSIECKNTSFIEFDIFLNITGSPVTKKVTWFVNEFNILRSNTIKSKILLLENKKLNNDSKVLSTLVATSELNSKVWHSFIDELDVQLKDIFGLEMISVRICTDKLKLPSNSLKWQNIINVMCNMYDIYHPEQCLD
jgi:hypothetical protein